MPQPKRPLEETDRNTSVGSSPKADLERPKPKKRKISKRQALLQWIEENAPCITVPEELKSNPNLQYIDIARLFFTNSKLQEWTTKINAFAQDNPGKVSSSTLIDDDKPEFSDPDMGLEYKLDIVNYGESTSQSPTPDADQAPRGWVDVSPAEMEIFLGIRLQPGLCTVDNNRNSAIHPS
jgi:hypothetical protein